MKILLINIVPPGEDLRVSLGIASLKAYAMQWPDLHNKVSITIKSFNTDESSCLLIQRIEKLRPSMIGFSCFVWNLTQILQLVSLVKLVLPNIYIILGGPEVSPIANEVLVCNKDVDAIVRGYGEKPFAEIIRNQLTGLPQKEDIKGITFRKNKTIIANPPQSPFYNLDEIPSLYTTNLVPEIEFKKTSKVLYETSRGCIFNCHFCSQQSQQEKSIQSHSLERIESEMLYFMEHELERVTLIDSLINFDNLRTCRILNFILEHNRKTKFEFEVRGDLLNKESILLLNKLARNKFLHRVDIGLQSIRAKVLRNVHCTLNLPRLFTNISLFQPVLKAVTTIDLIFGLPGDNYAGFKESLHYSLQKLGVFTQCTWLQVLPGTYLYENAAKFKLIFDPLPPHNTLSNYTYSLNDIIHSQDLVNAYYLLFDSFPKEAVIACAAGLKVELIDIVEKFTDWKRRKSAAFFKNNSTYDQLKNFFKEICVRYKQHKLFSHIEKVLYVDCAAVSRKTTHKKMRRLFPNKRGKRRIEVEVEEEKIDEAKVVCFDQGEI